MDRKHIEADVGVVIGRFQVNKLHAGHIELLDWVFSQHKKVILFLGISPSKISRNNPLDFEARCHMIKESYPKFIIIPIVDKRDDKTWSLALDLSINNMISPGQSVVLYGSRDSFIKHYTGGYKTQELIGDNQIWSGSQVRDSLRKEVINDENFRAGVIWATQNQYPRVLPTVDVACFNDGEILLVNKPDEELYRFPGGFVDILDENYAAAALRELKEETCVCGSDPIYVTDCKIRDWRYSNVDIIHTTLFKVQFQCGIAKANDDVCRVGWNTFGYLREQDFVEEHRGLFRELKK